MQRTILLIATGALLAVGCNSKPTATSSEAESPAPATADAGASKAFKDRASNAVPAGISSTGTTAKTAKPATKRAPFPPATAAVPGAETSDQAGTENTDATKQAEIRPEDIPLEGDQILVAPKFLGALLPGIDLDKIERTEPLDITSLLTTRGVEITNYQQLVEMGVTNYQILRAQKPVNAKAGTTTTAQ
jgi:hypothetical protein